MPETPLPLTGERTVPGIPDENYWFRRHEAAYLALRPFVRGATVLEAGCGEGYGCDLLVRTARRVVGLELDPTAAAHARRRYPGCAVLRCDLQRMPVADGAAEVVASLQTLEHLHDQPGFVDECARVLRPAGTLMITTPNRLTFSPTWTPGTPHLNPFHTREVTAAELGSLLSPRFVVQRTWAVRPGRRLRRFDRRHGPLERTLTTLDPRDWSPAVRRLVHSVTAADFTVGTGDVDSGLDLVVVAVKR